jgi:hypothetical protein
MYINTYDLSALNINLSRFLANIVGKAYVPKHLSYLLAHLSSYRHRKVFRLST